MTEFEAIKVLRTGARSEKSRLSVPQRGKMTLTRNGPFSLGVPPKTDDDKYAAFTNDIKRMMGEGWRRPTAPFNAFKQRLWDQNEAYLVSVLNE